MIENQSMIGEVCPSIQKDEYKVEMNQFRTKMNQHKTTQLKKIKELDPK